MRKVESPSILSSWHPAGERPSPIHNREVRGDCRVRRPAGAVHSSGHEEATPFSLTGENPSFREQVKRVFLAVCDLDPAIRRNRLEELCGANQELLREVETLLKHDFEDNIFDEDDNVDDEIPFAPVEWIGRTIQSYKLLERIGAGGMGEVFRGEDVRLKRPVAVKFLGTQMIGDEPQRERFLREAQAAAALNHPSICTVYDIGDAEGRPYIVTAYLAGETLENAIQLHNLSSSLAVQYAIEIAAGLQAAHAKGIVHRDLKPSNVILARQADGSSRAVIIDFGLARVSWDNRLTQPGRLVGTANYICPEFFQGKPIEELSDIWSLGVMLYEMLAGKPPFEAENLEQLFYQICHENPAPLTTVNPALPQEAVRIVAKALEKDSQCRYQDMGSLLEDLRVLKSMLSPEDAPLPARPPLAGATLSPTRARASSGANTGVQVRRNARDLTALMILAAIVMSWFVWTRVHPLSAAAPGLKRIAILQFEDLGLGERNDRISRMVGDSLAVQMAGLSNVRMISGSLIRSLQEKGAADREISKQLHLDYLVTGSTMRSGDTLQVTMNLISGKDDGVLWSKKVDLPWAEILTMQSRFAETPVREMEAKLAHPGK
jgi:serine/threonine protein kinase/TolB-like protein